MGNACRCKQYPDQHNSDEQQSNNPEIYAHIQEKPEEIDCAQIPTSKWRNI
jgi:hypothetical protein